MASESFTLNYRQQSQAARQIPLKIAVVSSWVPKKCGIATFARDLVEGIKSVYPALEVVVVAAETNGDKYDYDPRLVVAKINTENRASYAEAGKVLAELKPDVVLLQHEYGLFGGRTAEFSRGEVLHQDPTGDYVFDLLDQLDCPVITTLHTVLPEPDPDRQKVTKRLAARSSNLITMIGDSANLLESQYGIDRAKINVIPHGVPRVPVEAGIRTTLGIDSQATVLTITGLLSHNKGIDIAIRALPEIIVQNPSVQLYVIGQTHPNVLAKAGEEYRDGLERLAEELGVADHLVFVNKYLPTADLMRYMAASDIYLTLHRDAEQAASGTLAYALGSGLVCVSTPFRYSQEVLKDGRGFIVEPENPGAVAETINCILSRPELRQTTKRLAAEFGSSMAWPVVARSYLQLARLHQLTT